MSLFNYVWRLFGTALSFVTFGLGGVFLTLFIFPVISLKSGSSEKSKQLTRKIIHKSFRLFINMMSVLGLFDFNFEQAERVLSIEKGKVIIANHPSLIDVVVLIAILPHADCIVKKTLWNNIFLKGVVKSAEYIKNNENIDALMKACKKSLESGYSLIIFPEGTRTLENETIKLRRGASNIALRCNANMIPVTIHCNPSTLTKNEPWYSIPKTKATFSVLAGEQIEVSGFINSEHSTSVSARQLTVFTEKYFNKEIQKYA